ncbi:MAG: type II secretion system F family protein [Anaerolineae bacterium]
MVWLIALLVAGTLLSIFVAIYHVTGPEARIETRLESMPAPTLINADRNPLVSLLGDRLQRRLVKTSFAERIATNLAQANLKLTVNEYIGLHLALIFGSLMLGLIVTRQLASGLALATLAYFVPGFYVKRLQQRRLRQFQEQLPDTLSMLVSSLKAGYGLAHALEVVSQEMPDPTGEEFARVVREMALGFSLPEALEHLARRVNSDDLELVVTAITVQHEVGGNLAEILETISETIRDRIRLKGEIAVMTTQQRMAGFVLSGMPFILGTLLMFINPDYMMGMFRGKWIVIPGGALIMMGLGNLVMRRILHQEF